LATDLVQHLLNKRTWGEFMPLALYWLALGAFCIGTGTLMVSALLPAIAGDVGSSPALVGQLVTVNALTYAISSPILSTLLGNSDRKLLLVISLVLYALASLLTAATGGLGQLMAVQVLLALAAGVFMPAANATAALIVEPEKRGRAIAIVVSGLSISVAVGVPAAAVIGSFGNWRVAFLLVAAISIASALGLLRGLPSRLPAGTATLAERMAIGRRPEVLLALAVTLFWAAGVFSFYTYVVTFLTDALRMETAYVPLMLFLFGVAGWIGSTVGGRLTDRNGPIRTLAAGLTILSASYAVYSLIAYAGPSPIAMATVIVALVIGAMAGWSFHPSQTARLVQLVPSNAVVALSLNASALYIGNAAGAALGGLTLSFGTAAELGFTAAACQAAALAMLFLAVRSATYRVAQPQPGE
jgi:predicted MFS family arabinose efflux permease